MQSPLNSLYLRINDSTMKTIRYCNDPFEAQVIRARLENEGIPACVINENINTMLPYATAMSDLRVQVVVDDADAERALALLAEGAETNDVAPVCPRCGSEEVVYGFWGGWSGWKRVAVFLSLFAAFTGGAVGNLQNRYYCRRCRYEFKPGGRQ